jgi:creatinine amidohydrolase
MTAPRRLGWGDYASREFTAADPMTTIAVLPTAAIEQHGPHLPVCVDSAINRGLQAMIREIIPAGMDVRFLPTQDIGKSNEHLRMPGTLSIPAPLLIDLWTEIGLSVARGGVRKLIIFNSHGGNDEVMGIVGRELRVRANMLVVKCPWSRLGLPEGLYSERERRYGIHGGDVETSMMLHFHPELVDMSRAEDFRSVHEDDEQRFALLNPEFSPQYSWIAGDLNPAGAVGEAHLATAEKGRKTAEHVARRFLVLLDDVKKAKLPE